MKLFVFGAGASYAAQNHLFQETNLRCPLTRELFDEKYYRYLDLIFLKKDDFEFFKKGYSQNLNLENWLTDKWNKLNKFDNYTAKEREFNLFSKFTFYIWCIFWQLSQGYDESVNLYTIFFKKIKKNLDENNEDYRIITFNYDVFLDRAFLDVFDQPLNDLDDYIRAHILKPHGSINWFLKPRENDKLPEHVTDNDVRGRINRACSQLYRGIPFEMGKNVYVTADHPHFKSRLNDLINERFDRRYYYPLILIPLTEKITDLVKGFNELIVEKARRYFDESSEIYLIGYRANDQIINNLFKSSKAGIKLNIYSKNNTNSIADSLLEQYPQFIRGGVHSSGFEGFLADFLP